MRTRLAVLIVLLLVCLSTVLYFRLMIRKFDDAPWDPEASTRLVPIPEMVGEPVSFPLAATPDTPLQANSTTIYCATLQLAWNELGDQHVGFPIQLVGDSQIEQSLNRRTFSMADLGTEGILVRTGKCTEQERLALQNQVAAAFPGNKISLPTFAGDDELSWYAFSFLARNFEFEKPFDRLPRGMGFKSGGKFSGVEAFGLDKFSSREIADQIRVLHYESSEAFILELKTKAVNNELILARVDPQPTMKETIDLAFELISTSEPGLLKYEDEVAIPLIQVNVMHTFPELTDMPLENPGFEDQKIAQVNQLVRFQLDEMGGRLESSGGVIMTTVNGHRVLNFNEPFLLMIRKTGSSRPYFAMWVGDLRFLVERKK